MTHDEALYYIHSDITNRIAYLCISTPDLPSEDRTSFAKEESAIRASVAKYQREFPEEADHPAFRLFVLELDEAIDAARRGESRVSLKFQTASERFEESFSPPKGPDFIAGPSGLTKP